MRQCCCWKAVLLLEGSAWECFGTCSAVLCPGHVTWCRRNPKSQMPLAIGSKAVIWRVPQKIIQTPCVNPSCQPPARALRAALANHSLPPTFCPTLSLVGHLLALGDPNTSVA